VIFILALLFSHTVQAIELPSVESYQAGGLEFVIDPRPHISERPDLYQSFRRLSQEEQQSFLRYRREILQSVLEKMKLPKVLAFFYEKFTPFGEELETEKRDKDYSRLRPIQPVIGRSLQAVSELLWRSFRAVNNRIYNGYSMTILLTSGSALQTNFLGLLGDRYLGFKAYRAGGLHFAWYQNRETGSLVTRFKFQTEKLDPNSNGTFLPIHFGFNVRLQKLTSSQADIPETFKGRTIVVAPVVTSAESEFSAGIHMGLNLVTSPFLVGGILAFMTGNHHWWALAAATPWLTPIGLFENYSFVARTWPMMFWKRPAAERCSDALQGI